MLLRGSPKVDHDLTAVRALIDAIRDIDPAKLRPSATLYVHIADETLRAVGNGVTRVEDVGSIVTSLVRDWPRDCKLTVRRELETLDQPGWVQIIDQLRHAQSTGGSNQPRFGVHSLDHRRDRHRCR
jgi:hypothetical protein